MSTDAKNAVRLLNLCMNKRIEYDSPRFADGMFCVSCHRNDYRKLSAICKTKDLKITLKRESGLPGLIASYKHRIGLFIGAFLGACILWPLILIKSIPNFLGFTSILPKACTASQ